MSEITRSNENFVGYEYKEITASREMEGVYADGYPSFGWYLPYMLCKKITAKKSTTVMPLIDRQYNAF